MKTNQITFRKANEADISNIVNAIISAEMSGTDVLSYSTVLGLDMRQTQRVLKDVLLEQVDGCELSMSSFLIAEIDGIFVGATSAWIEGITGFQSTQIKGNLLSVYLPVQALIMAQRYSLELSDMHIKPIKDTVQIGLVYVSEDFRGRGISAQLIRNHIRKLSIEGLRDIYIQVYGCNTAALKSYKKMGFEEVECSCARSRMVGVLPDNKKRLLKLNK